MVFKNYVMIFYKIKISLKILNIINLFTMFLNMLKINFIFNYSPHQKIIKKIILKILYFLILKTRKFVFCVSLNMFSLFF